MLIIQKISAFKIVLAVILFFWISFFAPLVEIFWNLLFLKVLFVSLLSIFCLNRQALRCFFNKDELPLLIFILAFALGVVPAYDKTAAMNHFYSVIIPIPIVYFISKLAFQEKHCIVIVRFMCAMAFLAAFYGIIEFFAKYNFIYENIIDNFCYISFKGRRAMSTQVHPAALATYLVSTLPLSLILITNEKKPFFKILSILYSVIIFFGLMLCFSRGGLIGLFISFAIIIFFIFKQKRLFLMNCLLAGFLFLILASMVLAVQGYHFFDRYSANALLGYNYLGKLHRFLSMPKILSDHPFLGLGLGQFRIFFDRYIPVLANNVSLTSKVPDCMYLTLLSETGLIGFTAFSAFIYCLFKRIKNSLVKSFITPERRMLIVCFLAGLAGNMGTFLTYDTLYWVSPAYLFWSYSGILSALSENV